MRKTLFCKYSRIGIINYAEVLKQISYNSIFLKRRKYTMNKLKMIKPKIRRILDAKATVIYILTFRGFKYIDEGRDRMYTVTYDAANRRYTYRDKNNKSVVFSAKQLNTIKRYIDKHLNCQFAYYIIKCNKCGRTFFRIRNSEVVQHPEYYRCRRCGGKLNLIFDKFKSD